MRQQSGEMKNIFFCKLFLINKNFFLSLSTANRWLKKMGYVYDKYKKGLYFDGHERSDVVEYRNKFLEELEL